MWNILEFQNLQQNNLPTIWRSVSGRFGRFSGSLNGSRHQGRGKYFQFVFSMASYLAFIKSKMNFYENVILNAYLVGEVTLFFIILLPLTVFFRGHHFLLLVKLIILIVYMFISYYQFFDPRSKLSAVFNMILMFALFIIINLGLLFFLLLGSGMMVSF